MQITTIHTQITETSYKHFKPLLKYSSYFWYNTYRLIYLLAWTRPPMPTPAYFDATRLASYVTLLWYYYYRQEIIEFYYYQRQRKGGGIFKILITTISFSTTNIKLIKHYFTNVVLKCFPVFQWTGLPKAHKW